jgi:hypothetical protein
MSATGIINQPTTDWLPQPVLLADPTIRASHKKAAPFTKSKSSNENLRCIIAEL